MGCAVLWSAVLQHEVLVNLLSTIVSTACAAFGDAEDMPSRVREMAGLIKNGLQKEWAAWEVQVLDRLACVAEKVRSKRASTGGTLVELRTIFHTNFK